MIKRGWSISVIIRYTLIQLPGLAFLITILFLIRRWIGFPLWMIAIIALISIGIDTLLFFFTWPSYDWNQKDPMIGSTGVALNRLNPAGHIRIRGEQWRAEVIGNGTPVEKGQKVEVCDREGLILKIRPIISK